MRMLLVVGTEGTGHHMLRHVLHDFRAQETVVDKGDYYPLFEQRWDTLEKRLPKRAVRNELERIIRNYAGAGVTHIFEDTSFPFGRPRNPLRRPDIIDLLELTQGILEVNILVLYRNPVFTVYSSIRRGFSDNICLESKMAEDNHLFIERQIRQLSLDSYRTLEFERFVETPKTYIAALSAWLGINESLIADGADRVRNPTQINQVPLEARAYLESFFTEARLEQWTPFYRSNPLGNTEKPTSEMTAVLYMNPVDAHSFVSRNDVMHRDPQCTIAGRAEVLRTIQQNDPDWLLHVNHERWTDWLHLYNNGAFCRHDGRDSGCWERLDEGTIILRSLDSNAETFRVSGPRCRDESHTHPMNALNTLEYQHSPS